MLLDFILLQNDSKHFFINLNILITYYDLFYKKKISNDADSITKKELSLLTKDQIKLNKNLSGMRGMRKLPGLVIVVDPSKEHIAVAEAKKLGIPVMGLVDTNCDPDPIDYIIACNDDALKSVKLILQALAQAIVEKKNEMNISFNKGDEEESMADADNGAFEAEIAQAIAEKEDNA